MSALIRPGDDPVVDSIMAGIAAEQEAELCRLTALEFYDYVGAVMMRAEESVKLVQASERGAA